MSPCRIVIHERKRGTCRGSTAHSDFENRFDAADAQHKQAVIFDGDFDAISNVSSQDGDYPNLFKQLNLMIEDPRQRLIAGHFVNALEPTGWIGMSKWTQLLRRVVVVKMRQGRSYNFKHLNQPACLRVILLIVYVYSLSNRVVFWWFCDFAGQRSFRSRRN